jgi:hypothetical protein
MAPVVLALLALSVPVQLKYQRAVVSTLVAQPGVCSSVHVDPSLLSLIEGAQQGLYVSDAADMVAAERSFCLQRVLVPFPVRRLLMVKPSRVLDYPGDVALLAEIADPATRERYLTQVESGAAQHGRTIKRWDLGNVTVVRLR